LIYVLPQRTEVPGKTKESSVKATPKFHSTKEFFDFPVDISWASLLIKKKMIKEKSKVVFS